jgi:hypothetical protein
MAVAATPNTQPIGRGTPYRGKLVALPTTGKYLKNSSASVNAAYVASLWTTANQGLAIEFPCHPKTIELARSATYIVQPSPFLPDGYHQYMATNPLEIPISFELHAFDRTYCKQGALTLLQIASRLHSFILPISDKQTLAQVNPQTSQSGVGTHAALNASPTGTTLFPAQGQNDQGTINPPVTVWLHLVWMGDGQPGISCVGYLKDVKVIFNGPLLKGPGESFNLPISAEFSFTFVHHPGHNNSFGNIGNPNSTVTIPPSTATGAFATTVRDLLYNTRSLVKVANYQGLNDSSTNTTPDTSAPATPAGPSAPTSFTSEEPTPLQMKIAQADQFNLETQEESPATGMLPEGAENLPLAQVNQTKIPPQPPR